MADPTGALRPTQLVRAVPGRESASSRLWLTSLAVQRQKLVTLDVEGVLTPEVWINVAEHTGIEALMVTTREVADYDLLMKQRLATLDEHGVLMSDVAEVLAGLEPLEGAREFLDSLREAYSVVLLSDTFTQFAAPLMAQLGFPSILCHELEVAGNRIVDYVIRIPEHKRLSVQAFRSLNYCVISTGDAYNDLSMIRAADAGALFLAPDNVIEENPELPAIDTYADLRAWIDSVDPSQTPPADTRQ